MVPCPVSSEPATRGKSVESENAAIYTFPFPSTKARIALSVPVPPKNVDHTSAPDEVSLATKMSGHGTAPLLLVQPVPFIWVCIAPFVMGKSGEDVVPT